MTFAIDDRVALFKILRSSYDKQLKKTPEEVLEEHNIELDLQRVKLEQQKKRLEELGARLDG